MFHSLENILMFDYRTKGQVMDALHALESMYRAGSINRTQYESTKDLLEDKLDNL